MGKEETTMRTVFHGGTIEIRFPKVDVGRIGLDFGPGFYVTEIREQAFGWAERTARRKLENPVVNEYVFDFEKARKNYRMLTFASYDMEWLEFIVSCRSGYNPVSSYDFIEGGIANDRVIDTVEGYINGTVDATHALAELSRHKPNHQICFLNQDLLNECVKFVRIY